MSQLKFKPVVLVVIAVIISLIIFVIEWIVPDEAQGTLLLTLSFWVALVQGGVAVVAGAELSNGKWVIPAKEDFLPFYPLILVVTALFLFYSIRLDIYPWQEQPIFWLNKTFFIIRNVVVLIASYFIAHFYVKATLNKSPSSKKWAVVYLLIFVITQSLVAYDWIMPLAYPWISTMLGGIFFVEAFYMGLSVGAIILALLIKNHTGDTTSLYKVMRDNAILMFGFALFWAGLFYAQFLVIWYGNLPHETFYFLERMQQPPFRSIFYLHILLIFIIPFIGLISKPAKASPWWVTFISLVVLSGAFLERILYINPVLQINPWWLVIEFVLMVFLFVVYFTSRRNFLGYSEA